MSDIAIHTTVLQALIFGCLGQIFLFCLVFSRDIGKDSRSRILLVLILSAAAYLVCSDKSLLQHTGILAYALAVGSIAVPAILWLTAQSLFIDDHRIQPWAFGAIFLLLLIGYLNALSGHFFGQVKLILPGDILPSGLRITQQVMNIGFGLSAFIIAYQGRQDDLIDSRRRLRVYFVALGGATGVLLAIGELIIAPSQVVGFHEHIGPPVIFLLSTLAGFWWLQVGPDLLIELSTTQPASVVHAETPGPDHQRLIAALEVEHLYREHGLTVTQLAVHISLSEHQLRRLINQQLGFRNFSAFISSYRLKEVIDAFADPEQEKTPILSIALGAGFQSITTFNRIFRQVYGEPPGSVRKKVSKKPC